MSELSKAGATNNFTGYASSFRDLTAAATPAAVASITNDTNEAAHLAAQSQALWLLAELAGELSQITDLDRFRSLLSQKLRWLFNFDRCTLAVRPNSELSSYALYDITMPLSGAAATSVSTSGLADLHELSQDTWPGKVLREGKPYFLPDIIHLTQGLDLPADLFSGLCQKAASLMLLPLQWGEQIIGALLFSSTRPHTFNLKWRNIATVLAMQLSGQLGSILAHQRTRQALQTLQRSQALNLFLAEKRLTGEIALALSHRLNNLLTQSISYYELSQFSILNLTDLFTSFSSGESVEEIAEAATALIGQLQSDMEQVAHACHEAADVVKQVQQFKYNQSQSTTGVYNWLGIVTEGVNQAQDLYCSLNDFHREQTSLRIELENLISEDKWVKCERNRAVRAVVALVKNALEACTVQNGKVKVEIRQEIAANSQAFLVVSVADNGPGLSKEALNRLYEPFFTTKTEDQKDKALEHLGLDLALVHAFALSLGGRLEYRNSCGTGACFILALPQVTI